MARKRKPFVVVEDTREQAPWDLEQFGVEVIEHKLDVGDYSIAGLESKFSIERKSVADMQGTLTRGRSRFVRELERAKEMDYVAVIIEGEWSKFIRYVNRFTDANAKALDSSILAFNMRFKNVHWFFRPGRQAAAKTAYKIMDLYHKEIWYATKEKPAH